MGCENIGICCRDSLKSLSLQDILNFVGLLTFENFHNAHEAVYDEKSQKPEVVMRQKFLEFSDPAIPYM